MKTNTKKKKGHLTDTSEHAEYNSKRTGHRQITWLITLKSNRTNCVLAEILSLRSHSQPLAQGRSLISCDSSSSSAVLALRVLRFTSRSFLSLSLRFGCRLQGVSDQPLLARQNFLSRRGPQEQPDFRWDAAWCECRSPASDSWSIKRAYVISEIRGDGLKPESTEILTSYNIYQGQESSHTEWGMYANTQCDWRYFTFTLYMTLPWCVFVCSCIG